MGTAVGPYAVGASLLLSFCAYGLFSRMAKKRRSAIQSWARGALTESGCCWGSVTLLTIPTSQGPSVSALADGSSQSPDELLRALRRMDARLCDTSSWVLVKSEQAATWLQEMLERLTTSVWPASAWSMTRMPLALVCVFSEGVPPELTSIDDLAQRLAHCEGFGIALGPAEQAGTSSITPTAVAAWTLVAVSAAFLLHAVSAEPAPQAGGSLRTKRTTASTPPVSISTAPGGTPASHAKQADGEARKAQASEDELGRKAQ